MTSCEGLEVFVSLCQLDEHNFWHGFYQEKIASATIGSIEKIGWNLSGKDGGQDNSTCVGSGWRAREVSVQW